MKVKTPWDEWVPDWIPLPSRDTSNLGDAIQAYAASLLYPSAQFFERDDPEALDVVQDELQRMTRLVDDLLLLARADTGSLPIQRKPVEFLTRVGITLF